MSEWQEYYSNEHKRSYWHNNRNNKTTWDSPQIILKALITSGIVDNKKTVPDYWETIPDNQIKLVLKDKSELFIDRQSEVTVCIEIENHH